MAFQNTFKRYELKYILTKQQKEKLLQIMEPYMAIDQYGRGTIRNLYFDTDHYRLIRRSLEKPVYKEKLRLRSYQQVMQDQPVFVELKKKYRSVVYKRRLRLPQEAALAWLAGGQPPAENQIAREIQYFCRFYEHLEPKVFLSYEREAYYSKSGQDLRITFDENILCRREALSLSAPVGGTSILDPGLTLLEIKTPGAIPLWLTQTLTAEKIYKTSFSKYGTAYQNLIFKEVFDYV